LRNSLQLKSHDDRGRCLRSTPHAISGLPEISRLRAFVPKLRRRLRHVPVYTPMFRLSAVAETVTKTGSPRPIQESNRNNRVGPGWTPECNY